MLTRAPKKNSIVTLSQQIVPVAQRIRRETTNLKIAGSNPVGDTTIFLSVTALVLWCNWLSLWTLNPAIRVQIPVEPTGQFFFWPHHCNAHT